MRRKYGFVIWPQYFDKDRSRRMGRKISKQLAVSGFKIEDLAKAILEAGYDFEYEGYPKYPRSWWDNFKGRFVVETEEDLKKLTVIKTIADKLSIVYQNRRQKESGNKYKVGKKHRVVGTKKNLKKRK